MSSRLAALAVVLAGPLATAQSTSRVESESVSLFGIPANGSSFEATLSANGRVFAFASSSTNLPPKELDTNFDVYVKDLATGVIETIFTLNSDCGSPSLSADGRYVAYSKSGEIWIRDRVTAVDTLVSVDPLGAPANSYSFGPAVSDDGRYVVFTSFASNLVAADSNGAQDVFLRDLQLGTTELVSVDSNGNQSDGPSYALEFTGSRVQSSDGRFVVFSSSATNLVSNDTNASYDVFLRDRLLGTTTLISLSSSGGLGDGDSQEARISADGKVAGFTSAATNLVAGDTNGKLDVFVRDLALGSNQRVSLNANGFEAFAPSRMSSLSADGRYVGFSSNADLTGSAAPVWWNAYRFDRATSTLIKISDHVDDGSAQQDSDTPVLSDDGTRAAFDSQADDLVAPDLNAMSDAFLWSETPAGSLPTIYCTGKTGAGGCVPTVSFNGEASLSSAFYVVGSNFYSIGIHATFPGLLMYGVHGRAASPFSGGTMCMAPPIHRAPLAITESFPNAGSCSGVLAMNLTAFTLHLVGGSPIAQLSIVGTTVETQFWARAPVSKTQLSNALEFVVAP